MEKDLQEPKPKNETSNKIEYKYEEDKHSVKSGESVFKLLTFETTKYNTNTEKCIAFWKAISESDLKPVNCTLIEGSRLKARESSSSESTEELLKEETLTNGDERDLWLKAFEELRRRKMDKAATVVTPVRCKICDGMEYKSQLCCSVDQNLEELNEWNPKASHINKDESAQKVVKDIVQDLLEHLNYDVSKEETGNLLETRSLLKNVITNKEDLMKENRKKIAGYIENEKKGEYLAASTKIFNLLESEVSTPQEVMKPTESSAALAGILKSKSKSGVLAPIKIIESMQDMNIIQKPERNQSNTNQTDDELTSKVCTFKADEEKNPDDQSETTERKYSGDSSIITHLELVMVKESDQPGKDIQLINSTTDVSYVCKCNQEDCICNIETQKVRKFPKDTFDPSMVNYLETGTISRRSTLTKPLFKFHDKETETDEILPVETILKTEQQSCNVCSIVGCVCQENETQKLETKKIERVERAERGVDEGFGNLAKALVDFALHDKIGARRKPSTSRALLFEQANLQTPEVSSLKHRSKESEIHPSGTPARIVSLDDVDVEESGKEELETKVKSVIYHPEIDKRKRSTYGRKL